MHDQPDYIDHIAHAGRQESLKVHADQCITKYQRGILTLEDLVRSLEIIIRSYDQGFIADLVSPRELTEPQDWYGAQEDEG